MVSGDVKSITIFIDVITELCFDLVWVCGNIYRFFELLTLCKATSALAESFVWTKTASRSVFFAAFWVRADHGIHEGLYGSGDCINDGRKLLPGKEVAILGFV